MTLPNFLIVGAAKSGTSSLDRYLSQHPDVYLAPKKEAHFFAIPSFPAQFNGPGDEGMNVYTIRDREEYLRLFDPVEQQRAVGESSVFYLFYPDTAERIYSEVPHAKIIIMLRNPVDRAYSAYMHLLRDEREQADFGTSLQMEAQRKQMDYEPLWYFRELGLYAEQVRRYLQRFPLEQVKVILFEEFSRNTQEVVQDVFRFLEVDPSFAIDTSVRHNESGVPKSRLLYNFIAKPNLIKEMAKPFVPPTLREKLGLRAKSMVLKRTSMEQELRQELKAYFAEDIERLSMILDRDLSLWTR